MGVLRNEELLSPRVFQPRSLHEAWELKTAFGEDALYISGGTLLRTQWENETVSIPKQLIDLRKIAGLGEITNTAFHVSLGALVPLTHCRSSEYLRTKTPAIQEAVRVIAAPSVRNLATLGGNIASGFGDILPALLVYDAVLVSYDGKFMTEQSLVDWLHSRWSGKIASSTIVTEIRLATSELQNQEQDRLELFRKVGRREAFTPSLVTVALTALIDNELTLSNVRIAAGGGSGRPQRLSTVESMLEGIPYEERILPYLFEAIESSFETYSDPFATEAYKKKTVSNLVVSELWKAMNERKSTP